MWQNVPKTTKVSQDNRKAKLCISRVWWVFSIFCQIFPKFAVEK
jgi:hypothetical protein